MLIDDHIAFTRYRVKEMAKDHDGHWHRVFTAEDLEAGARVSEEQCVGMMQSQRFVLSPQVVEACWEIANHSKGADITTSRDYLFTPAKRTWIEWTDTHTHGVSSHRFGLYLNGTEAEGDTGLYIGTGTCVYDSAAAPGAIGEVPVSYDFPGTGLLLSELRREMSRVYPNYLSDKRLSGLGINTEEGRLDLDRIGLFLGAALALINTPRISKVIPHDLSKLNRARLKSDKPPLLTYSTVTIRPDSGWTSRSESRRKTGEMPRHHVRAHLRITRGRVVVVRPHLRGNPEKGVNKNDHVVRMTGEAAGAWKGRQREGTYFMKPEDLDGMLDD
ncbi:hypothetical protein GURKE_02570 [Brevundimonas phage vB_BpoS-Gurke]|uniref:Uncharacterized protein n=1 Tax=Brevundimonas phage vB_BpoS-Gurke TaxID=2948599 RepID=A0A9E7N3R5_9CAUD|nr:hypothetical protein GURKE_02570 [Brevundimonas phage vB_BpoS-Gurke]